LNLKKPQKKTPSVIRIRKGVSRTQKDFWWWGGESLKTPSCFPSDVTAIIINLKWKQKYMTGMSDHVPKTGLMWRSTHAATATQNRNQC